MPCLVRQRLLTVQGELHNDADAGPLQASNNAAVFGVPMHLPVHTIWLDVYKTADLCTYTLTTMFFVYKHAHV